MKEKLSAMWRLILVTKVRSNMLPSPKAPGLTFLQLFALAKTVTGEEPFQIIQLMRGVIQSLV